MAEGNLLQRLEVAHRFRETFLPCPMRGPGKFRGIDAGCLKSKLLGVGRGCVAG